MLVFLVHDVWARKPAGFGDLPRWLAAQEGPDGRKFKVVEVAFQQLTKLSDLVTMDDLAGVFDHAVRSEPLAEAGGRFGVISQSSGGIPVRQWIDTNYRGRLQECPLSHLVMLAPPNHGTALAQLGKSTLARLKSFFEGSEPGEAVLNWLELGSPESWKLNVNWFDVHGPSGGVFPFVLTGQRIDRKFFDAVNTYTGEAGSDGVVRVASANLNYGLLRLLQQEDQIRAEKYLRTARTAFGVLPGRSHSGAEMGIARSITFENAGQHPTAQWVLRCLQVRDAKEYAKICGDLDALTKATQSEERVEKVSTLVGSRTYQVNRYLMLIFRTLDDRGQRLEDYEVRLTGGPDYDDQALPPEVFWDRQNNLRDRNARTFYLDFDALESALKLEALEGKIGFRILPLPGEAPGKSQAAFYRPMDFRSSIKDLGRLLQPNQTLLVECVFQRFLNIAGKPMPAENAPSTSAEEQALADAVSPPDDPQPAAADFLKDPARLAVVLARLAFQDRSRLRLCETPDASVIQDALRVTQAFAPGFEQRLQEATSSFTPDPLWKSWMIEVHGERLRQIADELARAIPQPEPNAPPRSEARVESASRKMSM